MPVFCLPTTKPLFIAQNNFSAGRKLDLIHSYGGGGKHLIVLHVIVGERFNCILNHELVWFDEFNVDDTSENVCYSWRVFLNVKMFPHV